MDGTLVEASLNTGVGHLALTSLTTGSGNSAFGFWAAYSNTSGYHNSAFGTKSLFANTAGSIIQHSVFSRFTPTLQDLKTLLSAIIHYFQIK